MTFVFLDELRQPVRPRGPGTMLSMSAAVVDSGTGVWVGDGVPHSTCCEDSAADCVAVGSCVLIMAPPSLGNLLCA